MNAHIAQVVASDVEPQKNALSYVYAVVDALPRGTQLHVSGWQLVATAPKDGTPILGFWQGFLRVSEHNYAITKFTKDGWIDAKNGDEFTAPDFWMPLIPPKEQA